MRRASILASVAVLSTAIVLPATPAFAKAAAPCVMDLSSVTAAGDIVGSQVYANTPPETVPSTVKKVFKPGAVRLSSTWDYTVTPASEGVGTGLVVQGSVLYSATYTIGGSNPGSRVTAIGGGWGTYKAIETSFYQKAPVLRKQLYGLRTDGVISRWSAGDRGTWRAQGSAGGFAAVKTMALISQTPTYDTFLANTRGGALYTIHIPTSSPMKPIVKRVRSSTWQGFEYLVAEQCGAKGTLLAGIDKETGAAHLYAVGHATGATTVIQPIGKIPGTFNAPVDFLTSAESKPPLNGE
ncbi:hypothetical protein [Kribbella catacumbae]|uniref:hypothetical protein n=1 Tax=Kribbella catacumbae TaxID=460086 RepID=UPI00037BBC5F|nr:hypothetical protein [Kribbella catacumbae]